MKILLVNSFTRPPGSPRIFPIQLAALASRLIINGHEVRAIDMDEPSADIHQKFEECLRNQFYDVIGVSFRNLPLAYWLVGFKPLKKLLARLRRHAKFIVVGGAGFSLFYELVFPELPEADAGVVGEGEGVMEKLVHNLHSYKSVAGLCYIEEGKLKLNPPDSLLNGEELPRLMEIPGLVYQGYDSIGLQSYRGCEKNCKNCTIPGLRGNTFRLRPLDDFLHDLHFLRQKGVNHFRFLNSEFNFPWDHSNQLLDLLIKENNEMTWEGFLFPDPAIDYYYLRKAEKAGCRSWHIDLESGNEKLYSFLHNGLTLDVIRSIQKIFPSCSAKIYYYFTYNFPKETFKEEKDTLNVISKLHQAGIPYEQIFSFPYMPYPKTPLADELKIDLVERKPLWHIQRTITYMIRPSALFFLKLFFMKGKY